MISFKEYLAEAVNIRVGKSYDIEAYDAATNRKTVVSAKVTDYKKKIGQNDMVTYEVRGKSSKMAIGIFKSRVKQAMK